MSCAVRLIWHRRDLRLVDNPIYSNLSIPTVSLYVFEDSQFTPRLSTCLPLEWNAVSVGPHAARVLLEAVTELQTTIRDLGGQLLVRTGNPVELIPLIATQVGATEVWWSEEPGVYEMDTSQRVRKALEAQRIGVTTHVGYTLYHPDDLPTDKTNWSRLAHPNQSVGKKKKGRQSVKKQQDDTAIASTSRPLTTINVSPERWEGMPRVMGDFRRAARTFSRVRCTIPAPSFLRTLTLPPNFHLGDIPTFETLMKPLLSSNRSILGMNDETVRHVVNAASHKEKARAGEGVALERLRHFIGTGAATTASRNLADVSGDNSSRLSVHLSLGTISPRTIYHAAMAAGESCSWLVSHMEMRDYFLYTSWSAGVKLYNIMGMPIGKKKEAVQWQTPTADTKSLDAWRKWALGETNLPLVDAALRELRSTGYCSNRVRQNAASFLTKDLGIDWRAGAEWFQFLLEDHCVGANWGNWMYFSGVGADPKHRHFRTISQALKYDPDGAYVTKWLPKLEGVSNVEAKLRPWEYLDDWANPIVDPDTQLTWTDLQELQIHGRLCKGESITPL